MKKLLISILYSVFLVLNCFAQAPSIVWEKSLGGTGWEEANSIQQTSDGGYIVAGSSSSNDGDVTGFQGGYGDFWIVKLSIAGAIQWQKTLGGSGYDVAFSVVQTSDGGYLVGGNTSSPDGDVVGWHTSVNYVFPDYWVVKLNAAGDIQWQKCLGGSGQDHLIEVRQTNDGGYIVAGQSYSADGDITGNIGSTDYWIVKLDNTGSIEWQKNYGGTTWDVPSSIEQTMDNGYIICGFAFSNDGDVTGNNGFWDIWIVKTDSTGVLEWQQCIGGGDYDLGMDIKQTVDGGYIVAGVSNPDNQFMTYKLNSNGIIQWSNDYGGTNIDKPYAIWATSDGGSILAGNTYSNDGDVSGNHSDSSDFWILKLDISGTVLWQKCLGGIEDDRAYSVQQTSDDGYVVTGRTFSNDGDVSINHGEYDYWVVKLAPDHCSASFDLYPDTIPLHYIAVNLATGVAPVSYEWN